jgi:cell wall-associated NlpC family hydrolase
MLGYRFRHRGLTAVVLVVLGLGGAGWAMSQSSSATPRVPAVASSDILAPPTRTPAPGAVAVAALPAPHPHVVEPSAGVTGTTSGAPQTTPAGSPTATRGGAGALAQPVSDAVIRHELQASGITANPDQATLTTNLLAIAPIGAPLAVQQVIEAGNEIAKLPYVWGGGHGTYSDTGYDCSGSISYVFAAAHLLSTTLVSGELANWGLPGPGKWITIFANGGHTFMYVAGLRFDTVALAETGSRWSSRPADESNLSSFAIRHPAGL